MIIGITVWGNRISPVFDAAKNLLILEISGGEIGHQTIYKMEHAHFDFSLGLLEEHEVQLLICGAICKTKLSLLTNTGIAVIPFITGEVAVLIEHLLSEKEVTDFAMPGCRAGGCCRRIDIA